MGKIENEKAAGGVETIAAAGGKQREHSTTQAATHSGNSASAQRARLLQRLRIAPLDTLEARKMLDILMPAARICELRKQGNRIDTVRVARPTDEGKLHSVALYVLQPGEVSDDE